MTTPRSRASVPSGFCSGRDRCSEHIARGEMGNAQFLANLWGMATLARTCKHSVTVRPLQRLDRGQTPPLSSALPYRVTPR